MDKIYTDLEILENRLYWIQYLMEPGRKKAISILESKSDSEARCCLGHACHILIPESKECDSDDFVYYDGEDQFAPKSVVDMLGLWESNGLIGGDGFLCIKNDVMYYCLASANDDTEENITPYEIGEYLQTVVMGGEDTPFKPISI